MKRGTIINCKTYEEYLKGIENLKARNFTKTEDGMNVEHWETESFRFVIVKNW